MVQATKVNDEKEVTYNGGVLEVLMIDQYAEIDDQLVLNAIMRGAAIQ